MVQERFLTRVVFWLHFPVVLLWFGLFFIPKSIWPGRVVFHFWFIVSILVLQLFWSLLIWRRFEIICPLTTLMQWLRGYPIRSEKNYKHSYIAELAQRCHLPLYYQGVNVVLIITLVVVVIQYLWR